MTNQPSRRPAPLLAAVAATAAAGAAYLYLRRKSYAPLPTVAHVDLARYLGRWYEVARLPVPFEKNCMHVTADYSRHANDKIRVVNTCRKGDVDGPVKIATATARPIDATNAKLKVQFFWPFEGDYWILDLDQADYQYALVGEPSRKSLWLLSRQPQLAPDIRQRLIGRARNLGFPVEKLLFTPQP
ncbi:lipocalin family protein [Hymenobacter sp. BT559]|uniref:lipocalin family protein n=1 Tax=Hymenobacter sp. BT559 TaxID=2795729 RepID=UPI0018EB90FD|nr:lipocalin family protein [Hymenobacter sp. BT559]MBJ6142892.1 lipocalin family protein [Hymenobacter sp. BT559]